MTPSAASAGGTDDELSAAWRQIVTGIGAAQRRIEADLEADGLSTAVVAVLRQLRRADGHRLPMSIIARDLSMTPGGFTKLADRMAREGLIDRRSSESDRRVVHAQLTPTGLDRAEDADRHYLDAVRTHVGSVASAAELNQLVATAARLLGAQTQPVDSFVVHDRGPAAPERRGRARGSAS